MNDYNRLVNQYNAIVEQNKQLQAELATAKINYQELHDECAADYADYKGLKEECEKYKKCLDEIKIINKDLLNDLCDNCGWYNTDGCDPDEDYVCESLIKIKQIINEVENE